MHQKIKAITLSLAAFAMGLSLGCGGGATGPADDKMVTGVAATGAPVNGTVFLKDSSSVPVEVKTATASDGSYAFNTSGMTPPFIIKAVSVDTKLYSLATDSGIANITPLTTMALAQAAGGADLDALYDRHVQTEISTAAGKMADAVKAVKSTLAPLMDSFGVTTDILSGQFSANHTGMDALLDAISVSVSGGTVTIKNRQSNAVIFTAPARSLAAGSVMASGMPTPPAPQSPSSGSALYTAKCAGCHRDLSNSNLKGRSSLTAIQGAIGSNMGGMGILSGMTVAEMQSISDALKAPASSPSTGGTTQTPAPGSPAAPDGATLYNINCAGCHGQLASSGKAGTTASRIQTAINGNIGGMGNLSSLTSVQVSAIATALVTVTPSPTPAPASTCGSCHAIPPASGEHSKHRSRSCVTCHGTGYSSTSVNAATHNNGVKDVGGSSGWNASRRSCSNSCHGTELW